MSAQVGLVEKAGSKAVKLVAGVKDIDVSKFEPAKFVENFQVLSESAGGASALRQLVLDLAVRGRLVDPSEDDGSADKLFSQLAEKREQFVATRRASRPDDLPPALNGDAPFPIPSSWRWVRFGQATICRDGQRIPVSKEERASRLNRPGNPGGSFS